MMQGEAMVARVIVSAKMASGNRTTEAGKVTSREEGM